MLLPIQRILSKSLPRLGLFNAKYEHAIEIYSTRNKYGLGEQTVLRTDLQCSSVNSRFVRIREARTAAAADSARCRLVSRSK